MRILCMTATPSKVNATYAENDFITRGQRPSLPLRRISNTGRHSMYAHVALNTIRKGWTARLRALYH